METTTGGAVLTGGRLLLGAQGVAGELGHMGVDRSGPLCGCGRTGCLEAIAAGKHLTTLALSEAGTGAHFYIPQTSLMPISDTSFLMNGTKTFVTNGGHVDSYVLSTMAATEEANPEQFSCVVVDADTQIVVRAFQRHFRPARVDGIADRSTVETLRRLIDSLPERD